MSTRTNVNDEFFDRFEALTFDDVVVVPGYSETLPDAVDTSAPLRRRHRTRRAARVRGDGQGDRGPDGRRDGPPRWHRRDPPQHVDRRPGGRGPEGQAVAVGHDHRPGHAAADGVAARRRGVDEPVQVLRRADHRPRRSTRRHPDEPRHPVLRGHRLRPSGHRVHDVRPAGHGARRHVTRRGEGDPAGASHREAPARRLRRPSRRPDHGQGHPEAPRLPERLARRSGPPAVRRRDRRRRRHRGSCRGAGGDGCRRRVDRHRPRPLRQRRQGDRADQGVVARPGGHRRQRRHRGRRRDARAGRRRRDQGRCGSRIDLHHPRRVRRRHAAALGGVVRRPARAASSASRSSPTAASRSPATSSRRSSPGRPR